MRWKLRKVIGKTILLYLSMSLAFIPKSLSGGACTDGVAGGGGAGGQPEKLKVNDNSFKKKKRLWKIAIL